VRHGAVRWRGYPQPESVVPWRGYFLWIGGVLLLLLFVTDSLMPRTASSEALTARVELPPIRIRSDVKGPEAVVIVTTRVGLPPASGPEVAADSSASLRLESDQSAAASTLQQAATYSSPSASAAASAPREAFAELVQPDQAASRKPKTERPTSTTRRNARARIEAPRQYAERHHYLACDCCGSSDPREAF